MRSLCNIPIFACSNKVDESLVNKRKDSPIENTADGRVGHRALLRVGLIVFKTAYRFDIRSVSDQKCAKQMYSKMNELVVDVREHQMNL